MADKREDKGTDEDREKQKQFIREKIVRQPPSGRQIMRKMLSLRSCVWNNSCGMLFGCKADRRQGLWSGGDRAGADHHYKG